MCTLHHRTKEANVTLQLVVGGGQQEQRAHRHTHKSVGLETPSSGPSPSPESPTPRRVRPPPRGCRPPLQPPASGPCASCATAGIVKQRGSAWGSAAAAAPLGCRRYPPATTYQSSRALPQPSCNKPLTGCAAVTPRGCGRWGIWTSACAAPADRSGGAQRGRVSTGRQNPTA